MMEALTASDAAPDQPIEVVAPPEQRLPVVLASPHSGSAYPPDLIAAALLDAHALRRSEDSFVDELFDGAPAFGAPLLRARFARPQLEVNREAYEPDPPRYEDPVPDLHNS